MRTHTLSLAGAFAAIVFCGAAFAADPPAAGASAPHGRMNHGPSPAAVAACSGKAEGTAVTWVGRKGNERTGKCVSQNGTMAGKPDFRPHGPRAGASAPAK